MFKYKAHISLLLLTIFLSIRLVGLHELTHSEDELSEECELCEVVISSNTTAFFSNENFDFEEQIALNFEDEIFYEYKSQFVQSKITSTLFGRPPPTV